MDVRYYYDPITGLPHIYDHGTEAEVEWVLARPARMGLPPAGHDSPPGKHQWAAICG